MNIRLIVNSTVIILLSTTSDIKSYTKKTRKLSAEQESSLQENRRFLENVYKPISGFHIDDSEAKAIEDEGANTTYGEITDEAVTTLLKELNVNNCDVFYDLGSGVGRMVVQVYLESPVKKSIGVELSPTRHNHAVEVKQKLEQHSKIYPNRTIDFYQENILDTNITDATIIYIASTCFSDEFMRQLTDKFARLKQGLRILTLRHLSPHPKFTLTKTFHLPMTWSKSVPVYLYKLTV